MVFADADVLVFVRDRTEEAKQQRAAEWVAALWETGLGRLSYQVLQEYYILTTRKLDPPRSEQEAREDVLSLSAWDPVPVDRSLWSGRGTFWTGTDSRGGTP